MSTSDGCKQVTRIAGETLTIYRFIKTASTGRVTHTAVVADEPVDGIVMEAGILIADNVGIAIPDGSTCKVQAGGVIPAGGEVKTNGSGEALAATAADCIVGTHIGSVSSADGDIIEIQFAHKGAMD